MKTARPVGSRAVPVDGRQIALFEAFGNRFPERFPSVPALTSPTENMGTVTGTDAYGVGFGSHPRRGCAGTDGRIWPRKERSL